MLSTIRAGCSRMRWARQRSGSADSVTLSRDAPDEVLRLVPCFQSLSALGVIPTE